MPKATPPERQEEETPNGAIRDGAESSFRVEIGNAAVSIGRGAFMGEVGEYMTALHIQLEM